VRPQLLPATDPELLAFAGGLIDLARGASGTPRGDLEDRLTELVEGFGDPKVGQGFVKLLLDRANSPLAAPCANVAVVILAPL
jgi:predicted nuclease of restriction endonuclease-like RecB superfamily